MTNFSESSVDQQLSATSGPWRSRLKYFLSASFVSLVLGFLGLYYTLRGSRTHLTMDIASESNVLDVKHPIADLLILFEGRNIEEERSNLKVLTIRLINDGEVNLHENDFDSRIPFGFQVDGGRVVRAQLSGSSSSYMSDNLHPRVESPNRVVVDKIIFDKGKFVAIDLLVLLPKNATPKIKPLGKIAGLDEIAVTNSFQDREQRGFFEQVFDGPAAVQISRTLAYAFIALLTIIAIGFSIAGIASIPSMFRKRRRRRIVARMPKLNTAESAKKRKVIEDLFIEDGERGLKRALKLFRDREGLTKTVKNYVEAKKEFEGGSVALDITHPENMEIHRIVRPSATLRPFFSEKLVEMNGDHAIVDPEVETLLAAFLEQLNDEGQQSF
jgi:hypothetical protein